MQVLVFAMYLLQISKAAVAPGGSLRMGHMKSGYLIRISAFQGNPALQHPPGNLDHSGYTLQIEPIQALHVVA